MYGPRTLLFVSLTAAFGCTSTTQSLPGPAASTAQSSSGDASGDAPQQPVTTAKELDPATLMSIAQGHYAELRACYENQLKDNPQLQGMVEVELTIDQKGQIREGRITQDTIGDPDLQFCIAQRILGWKFPPHADESLTVQFPFEFAPVLIDGPVKDGP